MEVDMKDERMVECICHFAKRRSLQNLRCPNTHCHCSRGQRSHSQLFSTQEDTEGCRFDLVCSRCFTGCRDDVATVVDAGLAPECALTLEHTTTSSSGGTLASLELDEGFYRTSAESSSILECFNRDACKGGSDASSYCAEGYRGPCKMFRIGSVSACRGIYSSRPGPCVYVAVVVSFVMLCCSIASRHMFSDVIGPSAMITTIPGQLIPFSASSSVSRLCYLRGGIRSGAVL